MTGIRKKVLILSSETIGRGDDDLGFQIMADLLDSLANRADRPQTVICWNKAVSLVVQSSPLLHQMKRLEEAGVEILSGILCLENLELTNKVAVGKPAKLSQILDLLLHSDVISL